MSEQVLDNPIWESLASRHRALALRAGGAARYPAQVAPFLGVPAAGGVHVSMDQIAMPGTLVSGKVTFSDGETGRWYMDQEGRLGLDPDTMGYRPPQEDIASFQEQLRNLMRSYGA